MNAEDIINVSSAKERFMGNYGLFSRFLYQFPERSQVSELAEALAEKDVKKSFELAHTIKGVAANLSLKRLEKPLSDLVETLRAGNLPTEGQQQAFTAAYDETVACIAEVKENGTALF